MFQTGLPFFVTSLLHLPEVMTTVMFGGLTFLSLIYYPFVTKMAAKWGKKKLLIAAFIGFVLTFGFTALSGDKLSFIPIYAQAAIIVVLGSFPQAIFGIIPQTIVADIALSDEVETGESRSGMFYAARTFAMKLGQSLAMLLFTSLATIGVAKAVSGAATEQAAGSPLGYRIVALVASLCCIAGGLIMSFFNEKKIMETINERSE